MTSGQTEYSTEPQANTTKWFIVKEVGRRAACRRNPQSEIKQTCWNVNGAWPFCTQSWQRLHRTAQRRDPVGPPHFWDLFSPSDLHFVCVLGQPSVSWVLLINLCFELRMTFMFVFFFFVHVGQFMVSRWSRGFGRFCLQNDVWDVNKQSFKNVSEVWALHK